MDLTCVSGHAMLIAGLQEHASDGDVEDDGFPQFCVFAIPHDGVDGDHHTVPPPEADGLFGRA